jgi:hypothetical protein
MKDIPTRLLKRKGIAFKEEKKDQTKTMVAAAKRNYPSLYKRILIKLNCICTNAFEREGASKTWYLPLVGVGDMQGC